MRLEFTLTGVSPLIQHNVAGGLDTRSPFSLEIAEITVKKAGNRTEVDDVRLRVLKCHRSLYLNAESKPAIPEAAVRSMIEASARKVRQAPLVREGLMIEAVSFRYDVDPELVDAQQFTAWLEADGRRIGLGDWWPEKSGFYGRFTVAEVIELPSDA